MQENENPTAEEETTATAEETAETEGKNKKQKQLKKELAEAKKQLEQAESALLELQTKYVALTAEYENYRKRSSREKEELYSVATAAAAAAFLPLLDNLDRAVAYAPEDSGLLALQKQFAEIIAKLGVTEMQSDGAAFDPNLHNAIMHEEDPERDESIVVQTFAKGYMLGDKVVRHAMVKVVN